jgi:hypothetical protein
MDNSFDGTGFDARSRREKRAESDGSHRIMKQSRLAPAAALLLGALAYGRESHADTINRVKGITAGAMLGAEVVLVSEAALGVQPAWAYLVGGAAGAGAGALGGYYVGGGSSPKPSSFLLAGGIAFVIPTMIAVVAATSFDPPDNYQRDMLPEDELDVDEESAPSLDEAPLSTLQLPMLGVAQAFSAEELHTFGGQQATELHLALLRGTF